MDTSVAPRRNGSPTTAAARAIVYRPTTRDTAPAAWEARRRRVFRLLAWIPPVVLLAFWQIAAELGRIDVRFFPAPSTIFTNAVDLVASGALIGHIWATALRVLSGFPIGVLAGVALGLLLGTVPVVRAALETSLTGLYSIPKLGIFPLLMLIFGIGELPKVITVAMATFLVVVLSTMDAVVAVPANYLDAGRAFRAKRHRLFLEVILPSVLPQVFTSLRIAVGMSLLVVIATEFINAKDGVGWLIWNSWTLFQPAPMYVGIVTSALMGIAATALLTLIGRLVMPWNRFGRVRRAAGI